MVHPHVFRSVLASHAGVAEYQVRQTTSAAEVDVVIVDAVELGDLRSDLTNALARCGLNAARVEVRAVDAIERHPQTGKLRRFIPLSPPSAL